MKKYVLGICFLSRFIYTEMPATEPVFVRHSITDDIADEEKLFIKKRSAIIKESLEKILNIPIDENRIPKIALCFSGGGFRAMIASLGFLSAADKNGILSISMYMASLSGSCWAIAPWIASGKSITTFIDFLKNRLGNGIKIIQEKFFLKKIIKQIMHTLLGRSNFSLIDIYGNLILNTLLDATSHNFFSMTFTQSHAIVNLATIPLPIYTAIKTTGQPYEWMEITPFEVGSSYIKTYIPTAALGREFINGVSYQEKPEQTLGYFLGLFGSAFQVNLYDIIRMTAATIVEIKQEMPSCFWDPLKSCIKAILASGIGHVRFFPAVIANFSYLYQNSQLWQEKTISLIDAGIDFNIPLPPLLRKKRMIDIIIIYDSSTSVKYAPELCKAEQYAQRKNIPFPCIEYEHIHEKKMSVFKDAHDLSRPIIIYVPYIKNEKYSSFDPEECIASSYCNTLNFTYKPDQIELLSGLAHFNSEEQKNDVYAVIKELMVTKYGYRV